MAVSAPLSDRAAALAAYLAAPCVAGDNCGLFVARWITASGACDLLARLDMKRVRRVEREGGVLAFACEVFAGAGFSPHAEPQPGDPICVAASGSETMAIMVDTRWRASVAPGPRIAYGRWPVLAAWRAPESV